MRTVWIGFGLLAAVSAPAVSSEPYRVANEDTALTVSDGGGRPHVTRLSGARSGPDWTPLPSPLPLIDAVEVGGERRAVAWEFRGARREEPDGRRVALRYACESPPLDLESEWTARPGPGPVEHTIRITNRGADAVLLPRQASLTLALQAPGDHDMEALWVEKGSGTPSAVGVHVEPFSDGHRIRLRSSGYSRDDRHRDAIPWLSVRDPAAGHGWYLGVEFSGNVTVSLDSERREDRLALRVEAGTHAYDGAHRTRVPPGGTFEAPTVFVGCYAGDHDDGANRLHRFVETHLRPPPPDGRHPYVVNNSWGSGMSVDEPLARKMIDDAAAMGIEIFHVDAGWYRSVGDWHCHPVKFPNGLAPVAAYARSKGMLFGLWVGWTQGGADARGMETLAVSNPAQQGWFPRDYASSWRPDDFIGADVCLGSDAARAWCLEDLRRMVKEYSLDLLEHDQRMIIDQCDRTDHRHTEHPGDVSHHATLGYYEVYDRLRAEHPKLIFEDCVNGGRMVDFGVAKRVHYICYTDTYDPLSNRRGFHDTSHPIPPSMCEAYIEHRPGPSLATFRSMLRSGMMGWCTVMCDTSAWSAEQKTAARRQFDVYKRWLRPLIAAGDLYHLTPRPDGKRWDGVQYFDPRTGKGVVYAFRGTPEGKTPQGEHSFRLRGLRPDARYRVWFEDGSSPEEVRPGADLAAQGVVVRLAEQGASELVYLEEQR
jgi:hypothetical protein